MDDEFARNMKENLKSGRTARRNQEKIKKTLEVIDEEFFYEHVIGDIFFYNFHLDDEGKLDEILRLGNIIRGIKEIL